MSKDKKETKLSGTDKILFPLFIICAVVGFYFIIFNLGKAIMGHFERISTLERKVNQTTNYTDNYIELGYYQEDYKDFIRGVQDRADLMPDNERCIIEYLFDLSPNISFSSNWHEKCDEFITMKDR